jgi:hypothetical protein
MTIDDISKDAPEHQLRELASQLRRCEEELQHTQAQLQRQRHQLLDDLEKRRLEVHLRARSAIAELTAGLAEPPGLSVPWL